MNKDKIIKDLKKQNDSLKMQYEYRNIRCVHLEKENERLQKDYSIIVNENCDNLLLEKKVEQLEKEYNRSLDKLRNLRVENEQLKKEIEELKQQDKNKDTRNSRQRVSNAYQIIRNDKLKRCFNTQKRRRKEEAQKKRLYKSRIDKAIEYNKNILKENWYGGYEKENAQKNIDILKGDSDEF